MTTPTTHIYLDPFTARIVYLTQGSEFPTKSLVIDQGKLHLFTPNTLVKIIFQGTLPAGLNAQNCWHFAVQKSAQTEGTAPNYTITQLEQSVDGSAFASVLSASVSA